MIVIIVRINKVRVCQAISIVMFYEKFKELDTVMMF